MDDPEIQEQCIQRQTNKQKTNKQKTKQNKTKNTANLKDKQHICKNLG